MLILLCGDWHGNMFHAQQCLRICRLADCQTIFVLGDFGYWEHTPKGPDFLDGLDRFAKESNVTVYFLDGNHENHPMLWDTYGVSAQLVPEFVNVRDNIVYSPRGNKWTWDNVSFLSMGGAYSIDRGFRTAGKSWWPEEIIVDSDIEKAKVAGKVDVLLCHDVPHFVSIETFYYIHFGEHLHHNNPTHENRKRLTEVYDYTHPSIIFHGHWHMSYAEHALFEGKKIYVKGLDCDGARNLTDSVWLFDTQRFREDNT